MCTIVSSIDFLWISSFLDVEHGEQPGAASTMKPTPIPDPKQKALK